MKAPESFLPAFILSGFAFAFAPTALALPQDTTETPQEDAEPDSIFTAVEQGRFWVNLRYRYESVDQDGFDRDAAASTLRTVLGFETASYKGFKAMIEFEDVTPIGSDNYNSTTNGEIERPVVADPKGTEVNQGFLTYDGFDDTEFRIGRQEVILDNARFIGNVGWRQNHQSFDAASVKNTSVDNLKLFYAFFKNANRIFGEDSDAGDAYQNSHVVNASYKVGDIGTVTGYWYYLSFEDLDELSTSTLGARFSGKPEINEDLRLMFTAEFANQTDIGGNANDVDANYMLGEAGVQVSIVDAKVGFEVLEGSTDSPDKFTTPLATLHAHNGWADKFLNTPDTGLEDLYLSAGVKIDKLRILAIYHDFQAESGGADYGTEIDVLLAYPINDRIKCGIKYADYDADDFSTDTRKAWGWIEIGI